MGKKSTAFSKLYQKRCVLPMRKRKMEEIKNGNLVNASLYSLAESYCIKKREESKT